MATPVKTNDDYIAPPVNGQDPTDIDSGMQRSSSGNAIGIDGASAAQFPGAYINLDEQADFLVPVA